MINKSMYKSRYFFPAGFIGLLFLVISIKYNIIWDLSVLFLLFFSAYSIGVFIPTVGHPVAKCIANTACGLGVIGVVIYFLLLWGIGSNSLYVILLLTPIVLSIKYKRNENKEVAVCIYNQLSSKYLWALLIISCIFILYLIFGSAPICSYDSLTKHLPITIYAGTTGKWYSNLIESIVYAESMLMQYTYSAMLYSLGAYKAITLFNVILFFQIFIMLVYFSKSLYKKTNITILAAVYFTTPLFFENSRIFYLEMLCIWFLFSAIILVVNLKLENSWKNLPMIAWLFGCSLFTKLTTSYTIFVVGIIVLVLACLYKYKAKNIFNTLTWFLLSGILFVLPFITSLLVNYYQNGNPLLPQFNGFFQSPYFGKYNYVDPFNISPLTLNIRSLFKIVFKTSKNVELSNGSLGIYLLLLFIIPIGILIKKDKKLLTWSLVPFVAFGTSCFFTYNLRYSMAIFMLCLAIIVINASICVDKLFQDIKIRCFIYFITAFLLTLPNLFYLKENYNFKELFAVNGNLTGNSNRDILKEVPKGKSVFSVNDPFKGDFQGFYSAYMWHDSAILQMIQCKNLSLESYVKAFDYVLYDSDAPIENDKLAFWIAKAGTSESMLTPYAEKKNYNLYKVNSPEKYSTVVNCKPDTPVAVNLDQPIFYKFSNENKVYKIKEDLTNEEASSIEGRYQINWYGKDDSLVDVYLQLFYIIPGKSTYISRDIRSPRNAAYGILVINTNTKQKVLVNDYTLNTKIETKNLIKDLSEKFYSRYFLKYN